MLESLLITFRESLEAALIIGIVLAFLNKNKLQNAYSVVWIAVFTAIFLSLIFAYVFSLIEGGFSGVYEQIFEGSTMLIASAFLTYMILWLYRQKSITSRLKQKILKSDEQIRKVSLYFLVMFAVLREGVETALFLKATSFNNGNIALAGGVIGIFLALATGYLLFVLEIRLPIKRFFQITSVLLIFFAGGLLAHGIHELQEAGIIHVFIDHLYDINFIFDENSSLGQLVKGILGYNGNPSLIEFIVYIVYILSALYLFWRRSFKSRRYPSL